MADLSRWSYTTPITWWSVSLDKYSQPEIGEPVTVMGSWIVGGPAQRDDDGVEFVPRATFWFEATDATAPRRQWYIVRGQHFGSPPTGAELIRRVEAFDNSTFGDASPPDRVAYT